MKTFHAVTKKTPSNPQHLHNYFTAVFNTSLLWTASSEKYCGHILEFLL